MARAHKLTSFFFLLEKKPEHSSTAPDPRADKVDPNTTILGPNPDIFELRVQLAYSMAKRISNGASLEQVAFQNNMTVDQLGRMISVLATQSVQVNRALGMVSFSPQKSTLLVFFFSLSFLISLFLSSSSSSSLLHREVLQERKKGREKKGGFTHRVFHCVLTNMVMRI